MNNGEPPEFVVDKPVSGRSGWFWGGGEPLGPRETFPAAPLAVAWLRGNDYVRLVVTGYDLDGVLAIADSVR